MKTKEFSDVMYAKYTKLLQDRMNMLNRHMNERFATKNMNLDTKVKLRRKQKEELSVINKLIAEM